MRDYKTEFSNAYQAWAELAALQLDSDKIEDLTRYVQQKLNQIKPTVMVYGVYNAGKSTLLNALFGKKVASVADKPETVEVSKMEWNGFTIYDTPGIDAPVEHERVTDVHLRYMECIIFVVSSDSGIDEDKVHRKIVELAKRRKPMILVLNDKSGLREENKTENLEQVRVQFQANIRKYWDQDSDLANVERPLMIDVNAQSALKARIEGKKLLEERSGILALESQILEFLKLRGENDILAGLVDHLRQPQTETLDLLSSKLGNPLIESCQNQLNHINDSQADIEMKIKKSLGSGFRDLRQEIISLPINFNPNSLGVMIDDKIEEIGEKTESMAQNELKQLQKDVLIKLDSAVACFSSETAAIITDGSDLSGNNVAKLMHMAGPVINKNQGQVAELIKGGMLKLRSLKLKPFAGKWASTLGKWAGKTSKYLGTIVIALTVIWDLWSAKKRQEQEEQRLRKRAQYLNEVCERLRTEVKPQMYKFFKDGISEALAAFRQTIEEVMGLAEDEDKSVLEQINELNEAWAAMETLIQR